MALLHVEGMSCQHCVKTVTRLVHDIDPNAKVEIDLQAQEVSVDSTIDPQAIISVLNEEDYPAKLKAG